VLQDQPGFGRPACDDRRGEEGDSGTDFSKIDEAANQIVPEGDRYPEHIEVMTG
jgi:hypothetical protein